MIRREPRSRRSLGLLLSATIAAGLLSRAYPLPGFLAEYTGDALYATAVYLGLALVLPKARIASLALAGFLFCAGIELSQLWHPAWLLELRAQRLGGLVLGHGFQAQDFVAYAVGTGLAAWVDRRGWFGPRR